MAICDTDERRLKKTKEEFNVPYTFQSYQEMLKLKELETVVVVAFPNFLHRKITIDSLKLRKDVLCEKPPALNNAETKEKV